MCSYGQRARKRVNQMKRENCEKLTTPISVPFFIYYAARGAQVILTAHFAHKSEFSVSCVCMHGLLCVCCMCVWCVRERVCPWKESERPDSSHTD